MAELLTELHYPSQKSLANVRGVRVELIRVYREAKSGLIEPALFGHLIRCLHTVQAMDNGLLLERRVDDLETSIIKPNGRTDARPNGRGRAP